MSATKLRAIAAAAIEKYTEATVRNYVPILAYRSAVEEADSQFRRAIDDLPVNIVEEQFH